MCGCLIVVVIICVFEFGVLERYCYFYDCQRVCVLECVCPCVYVRMCVVVCVCVSMCVYQNVYIRV